jgi:hypothetical protein
MNRSKLIRKAASLPTGNAERRAILAQILKKSSLYFEGFKIYWNDFNKSLKQEGIQLHLALEFYSPSWNKTEEWENFIGHRTIAPFSPDLKGISEVRERNALLTKEGLKKIKPFWRDLKIESILGKHGGKPKSKVFPPQFALYLSPLGGHGIFASQTFDFIFPLDADAELESAHREILSVLKRQGFVVKETR